MIMFFLLKAMIANFSEMGDGGCDYVYLKAMIANSAEMGDGGCDYVFFKGNDR